jgi:ABC-type sugar transport system substrate-binding protein
MDRPFETKPAAEVGSTQNVDWWTKPSKGGGVMSKTIALMLALAVVTAGVLAAGSSGARQTPRTIGLIVPDNGAFFPTVENGAKSEAAALGDQLDVTVASDAPTQISAIKSLITQHAAAIAIDTDQGPTTVKQVLPALARARTAGIPTLSYDQPYSGSVWVSQSSPAQFADALADALASQMKQRGEYVIVSCRPAESIVGTWLKAAEAYIPHRYPQMHRDAVVYGGTGNGAEGTLVLKPLLKAHPRLRGLIFLCPSETYTGPPQLIQAHKVGKIFTVANSGGCPPLSGALARYVRRGATEIVCAGDPTNLGHVTVWAADYLAAGHTFAPGSINVGDPVGTVQYYSQNEELRLGQPLTITKTNLAQYAGK